MAQAESCDAPGHRMQRGHRPRGLAGQVHLAGEVHLAAQTRWLSKQGPKNSRLGQAGRSRSGRQAFQGPRPPGQTRLREAVQPLPPSLRPPLSFIAVESLKKKNLAPQTPFQRAATPFPVGGLGVDL